MKQVMYKLTTYLNNNSCNGPVNARLLLPQIYGTLASPLTAGLGREPGNENPASLGSVSGDSEMKQQGGTDQCLGILFYVVWNEIAVPQLNELILSRRLQLHFFLHDCKKIQFPLWSLETYINYQGRIRPDKSLVILKNTRYIHVYCKKILAFHRAY